MALMRHSILFLLIFSFTALKAQLSISPSQKGDSYLYVKDRLIFVQNDINLIKNYRNDTEASLYLRKGSQLLQGEKTNNLNSGDGLISVFQKGTSNAYDYNYWGLPVKVTDDNAQLNDFIYDPLAIFGRPI